jgi:hypothetical protein
MPEDNQRLEERLDKIESQLSEINEVFQAVQGGLKTVEFLGRVTKALLPILIFCGIAWSTVKQYIPFK